jgi:hypothetical protein
VVAMLAACQIPSTWIVTDNIEFDSVVAGPAVSSSISFGSWFTVTPTASAVYNGISYPPDTVDTNVFVGWTLEINSITQTGATVVFTPLSTFNYIKLTWAAAQGETLQIFSFSQTLPSNWATV